MSDRYIPSLQRIIECARELPAAGACHDDTYQVPVPGGKSVFFRRIRFKRSGGIEYRWVYEGKVLVDQSTL